MISMKEAFDRFLVDQIQPKLVFCVFGDVLKSIDLSELNKYIPTYRVTGIDPKYNVPVFEYYNV